MQDAGVDPFKASIDLLCRDGVNSAGDALMFEFIRTCVAKLGFEALWEASQIGEGALKREELLKRYQSSDHEDRVRELTRAFWFDLAVRVSVACDEALRRYPDGNVGANDLPTLTYNLNDDASEIWMRLFNPKGDEGLVVSEKIEVKITKEVFDSYRASVDKTFRRVARSFATSICAYDVDMVLFSGKTAEFQAVRDVFQQHMALPRSAIRCMADYEVGGWCDGLTDAKGRIADSKVSTALGGALYLLRTDSSVNMTFLDSVPDLPCEWGFVADHWPVAFARPIFDEGRTEKDVPLNGYRKLIARRTRFSSTAVLSYELRFKPGRIEEHGGLRDNSAWVRLVYDGNTQALAIKACGGMYTDFKEVALDDVECRVCSMNGAFMMDRIVDIVA